MGPCVHVTIPSLHSEWPKGTDIHEGEFLSHKQEGAAMALPQKGTQAKG